MNDLKDLLISRIQDIKLLTQNQQVNHQQGTQNNFEPNKSQKNSYIINPDLQKILIEFSLDQTHLMVQRTNQEEVNENKKIKNKLNLLLKKKQKLRLNAQNKLLLALNNSTFLNHKQIQDFYLLSLQIFQAFDPQFSKYKNQSYFMSVSMQQNLKKLYSFFFLKHDQQESGKLFTLEVSRLEIMDLSPPFFLGWIKKWSTSLLESLLNLNEDNNEFKMGVKLEMGKIKQKILNKNLTFDIFSKKDRSNSFNFLTENKTVVESPHKRMRQIKENRIQNTFQGKINKLLSSLHLNQSQIYIPINSKQMVYSYCLEELKTYYKNYPLEDLDHGYLKGFKKMGKKGEILVGLNSKNSIQTLIESKNASIKSSMNKFQNQYSKFKLSRNMIVSKKQRNLTNNSIKSQNHFSTNQRQNENQSEYLNFNQNKLSSLGSKLLSPIKKTHDQKKKKLKIQTNKKDGFENQNIKHQQYGFQNERSNSVQLKSQIINYNQIFSQKKNDQILKNQAKIELLKRFNQRFRTDQKQNFNNDCQRQFQRQKNNTSEEINEPNNNLTRLPKLSLKAKSKQFHKKKILISQTDQRFNKSELIPQKKKQYFLDKLNTEELNEIIYLENTQIQRINQKQSELIAGKRFISQVSQKEIQRSMSHFSSNSKLFIGSKKPSLNMVRFPKNKTLINNQSPKFQALTAFRNKLKDKNSLKIRNKNQKVGSENSGNVFSPQKIGSDSEGKKDQFIEYLKNLHRQKIKSEVFKNRQSKQKQNHIKKRSP